MRTALLKTKAEDERLFKKALGAQVAQLRHARKLTQAIIRQRTELSVEYISRLENGQENPTTLTLRNLVHNGLDMRLLDFFRRLKA